MILFIWDAQIWIALLIAFIELAHVYLTDHFFGQITTFSSFCMFIAIELVNPWRRSLHEFTFSLPDASTVSSSITVSSPFPRINLILLYCRSYFLPVIPSALLHITSTPILPFLFHHPHPHVCPHFYPIVPVHVPLALDFSWSYVCKEHAVSLQLSPTIYRYTASKCTRQCKTGWLHIVHYYCFNFIRASQQ